MIRCTMKTEYDADFDKGKLIKGAFQKPRDSQVLPHWERKIWNRYNVCNNPPITGDKTGNDG